MPQLSPETFRPAERQMLKVAAQQKAAFIAEQPVVQPVRPEPRSLPPSAYVAQAHIA